MNEPISIQTLLNAGVHFGHQTRRWNPKMKPYIFDSRGDIYIIDLKQTMVALDAAYSYVSNMVAKGGTLLFVGTKKQAQQAVKNAATSCDMPYVDARWLGGMLTNFATIHSRIKRMEELETMQENGQMALLPKKEQAILTKQLAKLNTNLGGVREMRSLPNAIFVVDTTREEIAIREARRLGITVIGMIDTNADPDEVDYGIPSNDDAIRSVDLICQIIADAAKAGSAITVAEMEAAQAEADAQAAEGQAAPEPEPVREEAKTLQQILEEARAEEAAQAAAGEQPEQTAAEPLEVSSEEAAEEAPAETEVPKEPAAE